MKTTHKHKDLLHHNLQLASHANFLAPIVSSIKKRKNIWEGWCFRRCQCNSQNARCLWVAHRDHEKDFRPINTEHTLLVNPKFLGWKEISFQALNEPTQSLLNIPTPKKIMEENDSELVSNADAFISQAVPFNYKDLGGKTWCHPTMEIT